MLRERWNAQIRESGGSAATGRRHLASLAGVKPKDLHDTSASQLPSVGIPVACLSRQPGHSTITVTEKRCAR
jgi:hypothetical protein